MKTQNFRRQHDELVALVAEMTPLLSVSKIKDNSQKIHSFISKFSGKLKAHLSMEDSILYPAILASAHSNIANKYSKEMTALKPAIETFFRKYINIKTLEENPQEFINELTQIVDILKKRIDAEHRELYPIYEAL
jgi:hemerythrin-like domain-containing protein